MGTVYVTGHRNPDTDSIAAAIGYAELKARLDPRNDYVPVRLGPLNAQTRWVLERAGAPEPREAARRDAPTALGASAGVLEGELLVGEPDAEISGRVWVLAMATGS